jgi:hypothetical protein
VSVAIRGMSADKSVYIQSAVDIAAIEAASGGHWRIFSKLGNGLSDTRYDAEIVLNGYACLPGLGQGPGREFIVSIQAVDAKGSERSADDTMQKVLDLVIAWLADRA